MSLPTEAVTSPGSGLVFVNYYGDSVTDAFRGAILNAEHQLQSLFVDATTVGVSFDLKALGQNFSARNVFSAVTVGYDAFAAALRAHATTADDLAAVAGLPTADPSGGAGFQVPTAEARILGLASQSNHVDIHVDLNSTLGFSFGQDAIGALEHEITEGVFGRVGGLGVDGGSWNPMDLFRFSAAGVRDYTGGADGMPTFFGIDAAHVTGFQYHNAIDATGNDDGFDLADWDHTRGDSFGPGGPASAGLLSDTDIQVLDVLGWTRASVRTFTPAADDFASSLADASHPFGQLAPGGSAAGALEQAGDRDWFAVTLQAGKSYTISLSGGFSGAGTVGDTYLRLHDGAGALLASNDDIVDGDQPDSRVVFTATTSGTYYVEAGAFADGYAGTYKVAVSAGAAGSNAPTAFDDVLTAAAGGDTIHALAGNDTITGADGPNYLRGDEGDDIISGGAAFDDINGNQGNDTLHGAGGDDWVVGGKDNDLQFGEDGADVVLGNLGDDTLSGGAGDDIVRGGQGNDMLAGGSGNDYVSGDRGDDTESGGAGADIFHSFGDAGLDRATDFNAAEGDRVMLDPGSAWTVAQVGADTVVSITGGAQLVLAGVTLANLPSGWIFVG